MEEGHYDYDFQLLPPTYESDRETIKSQYFVIKRDLDIYFLDIKDLLGMRDPNTHLKRVTLDLDVG